MAMLMNILEKAGSADKDFRYMAASDLLTELQKDTFKTDADTESRVCNVTLQLMEDASGDISSIAVKCASLLVHKVGEERIDDLLGKLCDKVVKGKREQQRDTAAIALKTIIPEVPGGNVAANFVKITTPRLIQGVETKDVFDVVNVSLEILTESVAKFGGLMVNDHIKIKDALLPELQEGRAGLRKRAIQCLAQLTAHLTDEQLQQTVTFVLDGLEDSKTKADLRKTYLQTIASISKFTGYRFGSFLPRAVPLVTAHCKGAAAGEDDDEFREFCLQALDNFVTRSPFDARKQLDQILPLGLDLLSYDPNYADDMEEDVGDEEDEYEDLSDEDYSDDEDMSWKVRRAAAKLLSSLIVNCPELVDQLYSSACPRLVERFKEREESVKGDVFVTFVDLLKQVASTSASQDPSTHKSLQALQLDVPTIITAAARQLREKSVKTRSGVLTVLQELMSVVPASCQGHLKMLIPGIQAALKDKSTSASALKISALSFLRLALSSSPPAISAQHMADLAQQIFDVVGERYYKVTAEALRVCDLMVPLVRPDTSKPLDAQFEKLVDGLFGCVMPRLSAPDLDQEVKEAAMACAATAVARLADVSPAQTQQVLGILLERLRNDITRLAAVKAFSTIAESPLRPDVSPVLPPLLSELTGFLRKANRQLKQASLKTLEALVSSYSGSCPPAALSGTLTEAATLVADSDLMLAAHSLNLCSVITQRQGNGECAKAAVNNVLPAAMKLVQSPLLQGVVLEALENFFLTLSADTPAQQLIDQLLAVNSSSPNASRIAQRTAAQCVAVLAEKQGQQQVAATVRQLLGSLQGGKDEATQRLALFCLGKLGSRTDLSLFTGIENSICQTLSSPSEDISAAASYALGSIAVGNLSVFVPFILNQIQEHMSNPKLQYLLLKSLNEVVTSLVREGQAGKLSDSQKQEILTLLFNDSNAEEECRNVVAECLGHLALLCTLQVMTQMMGRVSHSSANMRQVIVTAVRYMVLDTPHPVDEHLHPVLVECVKMVADSDRHVRKSAMNTLCHTAHNKVGLISDQLPVLLPLLYKQTQVDPRLIRTVDLGPFKVEIDDGLELRKAAFECLDVLLDKCRDRINMMEYITHLQSGLKDHYDVKMPVHMVLSKLAARAPSAVLQSLDQLVDPLEKTLAHKLKSEAVKQEIDRNDDMIRSCLRAIESINRIPDAYSNRTFKTFMDNVVKSGTMAAKFIAIQEERAEAEGSVDAMEM